MKRNPTSNKFRRDIDLKDLLYLIHLDLLRVRAAMPAGSAPSGGDDSGDQPDQPVEEVVPIRIADYGDTGGVYIKSTDAVAFGNLTTGVHVYADESLSTPAVDGAYDYDSAGLEAYGENEEDFAYPDIVGFTVSDGVITLWSEPEEEE